MLHRDKFVVFFVFLTILFSCKENNRENNISLYEDMSIKTIECKVEYNKIYKQASDTLENWYNNKLFGKSTACNYSKFQLDSLFCFNKEKNRIVSCVLESECGEDYGDGIHFFYGVKIKEQWYYFIGAYIFLPREFYQKDIHTPLSFEKLHEIAMREVFSGYLIKKKKDAGFWKNTFSPEYEYEVNEEWFDRHFKGSGWGCGYVSDTGWVDTCSVKEFEVLYKRNAISQWIKETQYLVHDTKIYSSINPPNEKWKTTIEKGRQVKLIYYVDDSEWCRVVVTGEMPNGMYDVDESYVKRSDISSNPP